MKFFYTLGIYLYGFAITIASLFSDKAKKWKTGRTNFWSTLPDVKNKKVVWFHAASLGEFEQGRPIIETWKDKHPSDYILLTFFSPSGYEQVKNYDKADFICYLPLDTQKNASRFIAHFAPLHCFFIKYEFWLNYIDAASKSQSKIYAVSALFHPKQRFFKWYGGIFRKALLQFDHLFVQQIESKQLLESIGIQKVTVSGDTRYDRAFDRLKKHQPNPLVKNWLNGKKAFVIGSSWPEDEELLLPLINSKKIKHKVIIAPHEVNDQHITQICKKLAVPFQRYTALSENVPINFQTQVLVLDCIGLLADMYQYGAIAYVGGAFRSGLHNILEPATFGLPVIFGPNHQKFPEAHQFIQTGIGWSITDQHALTNSLTNINKHLSDLPPKVLDFMDKNKGATEKIIDQIAHS